MSEEYKKLSFEEKQKYLRDNFPERFGHIPIRKYVLDTDPIKEEYERIISSFDELPLCFKT